MGRHLFVVLLGVAVARQASAEAVKTVEHLAPPLSFDRLGSADGLPNSDVRTIVQDRSGFLWFGTQEGLARYDGTSVRVYRPRENDPTSLSGGYITALALDTSGKLWVGTAENGVNLYDPETDRFTRFSHGVKGGLSSEGVTSITRDSRDRMWFAMVGGGLNRFDPATRTFTEYVSGPLETAITAVGADRTGNLWLGTASDGAIRWNPDDNSTASYRPTGDTGVASTAPIAAMLVTSTGKVWMGTDGDGLYGFDLATRKFAQYKRSASDPATLSDDHVTVLYEDRHHNLWIGTSNGLNLMDVSGKLTQYHHDPNDPTSLAFPGVESLYQDEGGVIWVGGFTAGVCKFDELRVKFGHYRTRTHPANSYFEDPNALWVGTYNGGLYKYDWAAQRVTLYRSLGAPGSDGAIALESAWISALHRDRKGALWIALKGQGLIAFDTKTESFQQYLPDPKKPSSLPVDTVWDIWEDERGALWLATWGGGLVQFDPQTDSFTAITSDESIGLSSNYLYSLYPDPTDKKLLWLGTAKGGVVRYDMAARTGTGFRHRADDPNSLSSDDVLSMHRDKDGALWLGTYGGGLDRLDPASGKVERFTTINSALPNDVVFGVLSDDDGKLWLSTNGGGLVQFDPRAREFRVFRASDGVQDNEFGQGSFLRSKSGKLYFGGVGGFNAFSPRDITRDAYVPPVALTGFKIFNQDVKLERPIWTLPAVQVSYSDSFEVQFSALSFAAPGKNRYSYQLEGFDDKPIETDRPFATYTKLNGGNYVLRIRAANRHGVWNTTGVAIKLAVTPPWWRTWPAFGAYVVILAGLVYLLFRLQQQKVRRIEREGRLAVVERDLALSGAVQSGFLPEYNEINGARVQLFGFYRAADACSGDWWWHHSIGGRHVVLVGDVTGHGPGPAMVTAAVATAFRVLTGSGFSDVKQALDLLNQVVLHVAKGKYHMTMAALELDEASGWWTVHSAGAPPVLSLDPTGRHKVHFCPGSPLGTESEFEIGRVEGRLAPGDRILLYTDGIPEIALPNGNPMGMRRFAQIYESTRNHSIKDAASVMVQMADQAQEGKPQTDDWTFALIEWR
jgi:ligand-binding sensor domain-containing protein/serine phosphatase RsbU (regulator of sigma subunit)